MLKLLYITTNLQGSGGVSRILSVKWNYLIQAYGYKIHVITTNNKSDAFFYDFNSQIVFHKIDIKDFSFRHLLKYQSLLKNIVGYVDPEIIINCDNGFKGALLPYLINNKAALIYERHGSRKINTFTFIEGLKKNFANFIIDCSIHKYKAFIVLNNECEKEWKASRVHTIPNPLWFTPPTLSNKLKNNIAVAIGRHSKEKQFDILLRIWQKVVVDYPNWILEIYGKKNDKMEIEKLLERLNLSNQVMLYNPKKNIDQVYQNASMLLNTSSSEAFGMVIIEAMAFGLPVIAFDNSSGPKSLINNEKNGFLVKNNDIETYVNKIKELIQNEPLRQNLGANAKETVNSYNLDSIMKQWHQLFQS